MKRSDLLRYLAAHDVVFVREGGNHSIYKHAATRNQSSVPRHPEVRPQTVLKICRELGIEPPRER